MSLKELGKYYSITPKTFNKIRGIEVEYLDPKSGLNAKNLGFFKTLKEAKETVMNHKRKLQKEEFDEKVHKLLEKGMERT